MTANRIYQFLNSRTLAIGCSFGFAAICLALLTPLLFDLETPMLRLSAGPDSTRRHAVAVYLAEQASENDLSINLLPNSGSEDCLKLLQSNQLDAAIVSNGVVVADDDNIVVLGAMQLEAVHLLIRKKMAEEGPLIQTIRGKRVNLGEKGSTEWLLSRDFLAFARLSLPSTSHPGDVIPTELTKSELIDLSQSILQADAMKKESLIADLPDCLIVLASMPSIVVQALVEAADYQIVPLPETRAFLSDNLQDSKAKTTVVQREFLESTSIPRHSYFAKQGFPETDCETVGVRLLVVARKDVSARAVRPLMQTIFEGEFNHRIKPTSPRNVATPYSIHPAALAYLDRDKPLLVNSILEWVSKCLSIFGAFSAGALSLYSLLRRAKTRNPSYYFAEIRKVEQLAHSENLDSTGPVQQLELLRHLDGRLIRLRHDLLEDICEGRIKGDQVISNIMMLLNDARRSLATIERQTFDLNDRTHKMTKEAA